MTETSKEPEGEFQRVVTKKEVVHHIEGRLYSALLRVTMIPVVERIN